MMDIVRIEGSTNLRTRWRASGKRWSPVVRTLYIWPERHVDAFGCFLTFLVLGKCRQR